MTQVNFFTVADKKYHQYISTFVISALITNDDCCCEVLVRNFDNWSKDNVHVIEKLQSDFPNRVLLRNAPEFWYQQFRGQTYISNWMRFVEEPQIKAQYTYVGDVDLVFIKNILEDHLPIFEKLGLPYTNMIRKDTERLTGCFMAKTEEWYTAIMPIVKKLIETPKSIYAPILNDEMLLYKLVENSDIELPDRIHGYECRPLHATIHCSPNRPVKNWGVEKWKVPSFLKVYEAWKQLRVEGVHMEKINEYICRNLPQ